MDTNTLLEDKEVAIYTSKKHIYSIKRIAIPDIESDFREVVTSLDAKGEKIDNKEVPNNREYIKRMNSSTCYYIYKNGTKSGFCYMLDRTSSSWDMNISSSMIINSSDLALVYAMYAFLLTKYNKFIIFPHGTSISDFKSIATRDSIIRFHQGLKPYIVFNNKKFNNMIYKYQNDENFFNLKVELK